MNNLILKFMFVIVVLVNVLFCEQVVRVNQEQSHFGYIKLYSLIIKQGKRVALVSYTLSLFLAVHKNIAIFAL